MSAPPDPVVDLDFPAKGAALPSEHGFQVFAAICIKIPSMHEGFPFGLRTAHGRLTGDGRLLLARNARLGLRLPMSRLPEVMPLVGQTLTVGGFALVLGAPTIRPLVPAPALAARVVTIKGFEEPGAFRDAVARQLALLGVSAGIEVGRRRAIPVRDKRVVGFAVRLDGLDDAASLLIQREGIGGRRRFGCGVFSPSARPLAEDRRPAAAVSAPDNDNDPGPGSDARGGAGDGE